jgi:ABC-2 type transport system ATP-binding protein
MDVVTVERLTKNYGRRVGVEGLNLRVAEGTMFGFLGPNGSGKTTTIRILMGFLRPSSGAARVFGLDCWRDGARIKAEVGYLPGDLRLYPSFTCREAMRTFGRVRGRDLTRAGAELAEEFGLDPDVRVRAMSRGMRQKLGLVIALAHAPRLLILDEPTASLDPLMQEKLYRRLRETVAAGGTVLLSSHTLSEVEDLCSQVAILRSGRLVAHESLEGLRSRARRRVTIRWRSVEDALRGGASPDGVDWIERGTLQWRGVVRGPVTGLLRWIADQPIEDVILEPPDLTETFRGFYR